MTVTDLAPRETLKTDLSGYGGLTPDERSQIDDKIALIDREDTQSIMMFGSSAQSGMQQVSRKMLEGVKNKDTGPAGDVLNEMVLEIRGFDVSELTKEQGWLAKLFSKVTPVARAIQKYETVRSQVATMTTKLEDHKGKLLRDTELLDRLYREAVACYNDLGAFIIAGEEALRRWEEVELPKLKEAAERGDDLAAEAFRKFGAARDMLERRVHDLKLTRQVTLQSLPSIGMIQDNDQGLILKIESTIRNTIPAWEIQLGQAVTIARARDAGKTVRQANDLTNDLLKANAENLRQGNAEIRTELERGVYDIEAIKAAHQNLIGTIEDSIRIAQEGRAARKAAEKDLETCEKELTQKLIEASQTA